MKLLVELTGNQMISNQIAKFSKSNYSKFLVPLFVKIYNVNKEEIRDNITSFKSIHELFTRHLKEGSRQINKKENVVVSPVDGHIQDYGNIKNNKAISVKGNLLFFDELFGSSIKSEHYKEAMYVVIYLSPHNYHRIHSPVSGEVIASYSLGNKSFPVNKLGQKYAPELLFTNYRKITEINTRYGFCSIVKVGALNINSIQLTYKNNYIEKAEEIGYFSFGSTVVVIIKGITTTELFVQINQKIKMGEKIALFS